MSISAKKRKTGNGKTRNGKTGNGKAGNKKKLIDSKNAKTNVRRKTKKQTEEKENYVESKCYLF